MEGVINQQFQDLDGITILLLVEAVILLTTYPIQLSPSKRLVVNMVQSAGIYSVDSQ